MSRGAPAALRRFAELKAQQMYAQCARRLDTPSAALERLRELDASAKELASKCRAAPGQAARAASSLLQVQLAKLYDAVAECGEARDKRARLEA